MTTRPSLEFVVYINIIKIVITWRYIYLNKLIALLLEEERVSNHKKRLKWPKNYTEISHALKIGILVQQKLEI